MGNLLRGILDPWIPGRLCGDTGQIKSEKGQFYLPACRTVWADWADKIMEIPVLSARIQDSMG